MGAAASGVAGEALLAGIRRAAEIGVLQASELGSQKGAGPGLEKRIFGVALKLGDEVDAAAA